MQVKRGDGIDIENGPRVAPDTLKECSFEGLCLMLRDAPARSWRDAYDLPEGEAVYVEPGVQFTVFIPLQGYVVSEVFQTIKGTWLKGPLLWTDQLEELDTQKYVLPDLSEDPKSDEDGAELGSVDAKYLLCGSLSGGVIALLSAWLASVGAPAYTYILLFLMLFCAGALAVIGAASTRKAGHIDGFRQAAKLVKNPVMKTRKFRPFKA
jgi:hypothetical protein